MRFLFKPSLAATLLFLVSTSALSQPQQLIPIQLVNVRPTDFCNRLQNNLQQFVTMEGSTQRNLVKTAAASTQFIVSQLAGGRIDEYYDVSRPLQQISMGDTNPGSWISVPELLVQAMGVVPGRVLVAEDINALKMVPQVAPGAQILLITSTLGELNPERAKMVAQAAVQNNIKILAVWTGPQKTVAQKKDAQAVGFLTAITGGTFLNLGPSKTCPNL